MRSFLIGTESQFYVESLEELILMMASHSVIDNVTEVFI